MWHGFGIPKIPSATPTPVQPSWLYAMSPTITITAPMNSDIVLKPIKFVPDKCTCDIIALMAVGCKCGQFQIEQKVK